MHASTLPLIGLIWPKVGCASIAYAAMAPGSTFFPWASPIPRAGQESLTAAILRCAAAQAGAASIAFGFQIAIEAAVVAELENNKET